MANPASFTEGQMHRLAASGVAKIDRLGARGTTLCTMEEIEAMACVIVQSCALPGTASDPERGPQFNQIGKDQR